MVFSLCDIDKQYRPSIDRFFFPEYYFTSMS